MAVLEERARLGLSLWHPHDAPMDVESRKLRRRFRRGGEISGTDQRFQQVGELVRKRTQAAGGTASRDSLAQVPQPRRGFAERALRGSEHHEPLGDYALFARSARDFERFRCDGHRNVEPLPNQLCLSAVEQRGRDDVARAGARSDGTSALREPQCLIDPAEPLQDPCQKHVAYTKAGVPLDRLADSIGRFLVTVQPEISEVDRVPRVPAQWVERAQAQRFLTPFDRALRVTGEPEYDAA